MYTPFFGFKENPFSLTPDPRYLFLSPNHKEAIDHLVYGIKERKGFIVITGGIGTGKTTLCRVLLSHLESTIRSALIFNSFISDMELLKAVNQEFGIPVDPDKGTKKDYIDGLNRFLLDIFGKRGNAVLLIDEAQNLSHKALEQIRMLSNLETAKEKLIQIILVGQPELREVLAAPSLRQLNERVMVRYHLKPLTFENVKGYVEHRMAQAGGNGVPNFTGPAFRRIFTCSGGNPRRINAICDRTLLIAYARGEYTISNGLVKKAVSELYGDMDVSGYRGNRFPTKQAFLFVMLITVAGLAFLAYTRGLPSMAGDKKINEIRKIIPSRAEGHDTDETLSEASIFLNERESFSGLFSLLYRHGDADIRKLDEHKFSVVEYTLEPEYYVVLKKPFRVSVSNPSGDSEYMLIYGTGPEGAVAIDTRGKEKPITRDFIFKNWGMNVSWVFPDNQKTTNLAKGTRSPEVLELQKTLKDIGYMVEPTGVYGASTLEEVVRFQEDFGLQADGIAGPRTKALLYQMVE